MKDLNPWTVQCGVPSHALLGCMARGNTSSLPTEQDAHLL